MNVPHSARRLTLAYTLAAGLWVAFSDSVVAALGLSLEQLESVQLIKGLLFVLLTGVLLYWVLRTYQQQQQRANLVLSDSETRLSRALSAARDGMWEWDLHTRTVFFSPDYTNLLGLPPGGLVNDQENWLQRLHPDDREHFQRSLEQRLSNASQDPYEVSYRLRHKDDTYRWIQSRGRLLLDDQGRPERMIGTASDITQRRNDEDSLRQAAAVFDATQEGVLVTDAKQHIVHCNPAFTRITGYSQEEILGQQPSLLKSGRHDQDFYNSLWHALQSRGGWSGEVWNRRKNGEIYPQWQNIRVIRDEEGEISHYVAVFSDITALKRSQSELDYLAHHDPLSNLPNRLLFTERVETALERGQRDKRRGAVLLVDLDHFKLINESLGHATGDLLLKEVGERLRQQFQGAMTLARLGGDEFVLLCEDCATAEQAAGLAQQLLNCLSQPFVVNNHELFIGASVGISLFPGDADNVAQVLRNVDSALFKAKSSGREGYAFYAQELTEYARQRVELVSALRHALEHDELRVYYQPLMCLRSRQFSRGELDSRVAQVLADTGLDPAFLELEVTESAVMDNPDAALALLERLRALGVRLAIDDFGTGYTSLARLKRMPVHKLKLDQSFVMGLPHDQDDVAITRAVIALGHSLGLKVLAEGIEQLEQVELLEQLGCDHAQGYYFGRPQPAEALLAQLPLVHCATAS